MKYNEMRNTDILKAEGMTSTGYGRLPRVIMKDRRLTPRAKLIFAYFCSYDTLAKTENIKMLDGIVMMVTDVLCSEAKSYQISGVEIDAEVVKQRFLELGHSDIA